MAEATPPTPRKRTARGSREIKASGLDPLSLKQRAFLAAYAECGNITFASECAEVNPDIHHRTWKHDPVYWDAFEAAHEMACDRLEYEARRRAVEGVREPIYHRGRIIGHVVKHSDALLMFLLKAERKSKFQPVRETGGDGALLVALPKAYVGVDLEKI